MPSLMTYCFGIIPQCQNLPIMLKKYRYNVKGPIYLVLGRLGGGGIAAIATSSFPVKN